MNSAACIRCLLFFAAAVRAAAEPPAPRPDAWLEATFRLSRAQPAAQWNLTRESDRAAWTPNSQAQVAATPSGIDVTTTGGDPFLTVRLGSPVPAPAALGIVCRQAEEMMYLDLFPAGQDEPVGRRPHLRRLVLGSGDWQTVWFVVEGGDLAAFRFDPPGGKHRLEIAGAAVFPLRVVRSAQHPALPKPSWQNTAYVVPIHESYDDRRFNDAGRRRDIARLKEEIGPGRLYVRVGFSASSPQTWNKIPMQEKVSLLEEDGLVWHAHHHVGNHSIGRHPEILAAVRKDRRNAAWCADGTCRGVAKSWDDARVFNEEGLARTSVLACVSRLNKDVVAARRAAVLWLNESQGHAWAAREYPEVMVSAGCSVENELPQSPFAWGCYSPYSVQEFQDWLRHRSGYATASRGAPESVVGKFVLIGGAKRSVFHDDPSPDNSNGTGPGFNEWFGTKFQSWRLEYWDFGDFPPGSLPWTEDLSNPLPAEGQRGNASGKGFDAPRIPSPGDKFWDAWDNENPAAPGYRQHSIQAWNSDVVKDFAATGFPRERLFTHQIPAEFLSVRQLPAPNYKPGMSQPLLRRFSTASPTWTADDGLGACGGHGIGITAFDFMTDEAVLAKARACDANWALLEYHPDSPGQPEYGRCIDSLRGLYRQRVHVLAPGWWDYKKPPFLLNGTEFARALKDWIDNPSGMDRADQPWDSTEFIDYAPPRVHGVTARRENAGVRIAWSDRLWPDVRYARWNLWREWAGGAFVIRRHGPSDATGREVATVPAGTFSWLDAAPPPGPLTYTVTARRTAGITLTGEPSTPAPLAK